MESPEGSPFRSSTAPNADDSPCGPVGDSIVENDHETHHNTSEPPVVANIAGSSCEPVGESIEEGEIPQEAESIEKSRNDISGKPVKDRRLSAAKKEKMDTDLNQSTRSECKAREDITLEITPQVKK